MGAVNGLKQKTYYIREDLARVVEMLAAREGVKISDKVNEIFARYIKNALTKEERRVFTQGMKNGQAKKPR